MLLLVGIASVHAQKLEKLVIGYPAPVASLGIIDVMRKGGLFKKNGLDVDLVYIQGSPISPPQWFRDRCRWLFSAARRSSHPRSAAPTQFISLAA